MMRTRFRSLQMRLAVRLAALYVLAMGVGIAILLYQAYDTAGASTIGISISAQPTSARYAS